MPWTALLSLLAGAACGSVPFGYFAGRLKGIDIRRHGSGNIGFTNVQRTIGWAWAVPVLLFDAGKGLLPTVFAGPLGLTPALVGLGAILGHVFCPWLGFNGGKGVATTIGVTAILCPKGLLAGLGIYLAVLAITGFVSLSSLSFACVLPVLTALIYRHDASLLIVTSAVAAVIVLRHAANVKRLAAGTEPRLGLWLKLSRKT
jgi:acyl phosphate:glycerol-3-phosphate acyltransferase